jgi:hypothetical protein
MKQLLYSVVLLGLSLSAVAQEEWPELDKSPLDIAYFPANTTFRNFQQGDAREVSPKVRVIYSRPQMNDRKIFGELVPFGEVWRLGANEATEITFYEDAKIAGEDIQTGTYTLSARVEEDNWTLIFSSDLYIWGAYNRDASKDVVTVEATPTQIDDTVEAFTMLFESSETGANLVMAWENTQVSFPIEFGS